MLNAVPQARGEAESRNPIGTAGASGNTIATPQRVFLSHTSDLGKHSEPRSFVAAAATAVLRARHAVTNLTYFAARDTSPGAVCVGMLPPWKNMFPRDR